MSGGFFAWIKRLFGGGVPGAAPVVAASPQGVPGALARPQGTSRDARSKKRSSSSDKKAAEHRRLRQDHWARRMPQLLENVDRRPMWQFRTVGDGRDPPACAALNGRVERFDSEFWQQHLPASCRRKYCRCTIRACTHEEAARFAAGLANQEGASHAENR